jgi:large subunit ribosomal protein L9
MSLEVLVEIILLADVPGLGTKGSLVNVSNGYARNYLIPKKLAEVGSPGKLAEFRRREEERKSRESRLAVQAEEITNMLNRTVLTLEAKAGEGERLFGSVTSADIAAAVWDARKVRIDKKNVLLEEPIKALGSYMVDVEVADGFVATIKTIVVPE